MGLYVINFRDYTFAAANGKSTTDRREALIFNTREQAEQYLGKFLDAKIERYFPWQKEDEEKPPAKERECPPTVKVKAIDVLPYHWALWSRCAGNPPFENEIVSRKWSEDGQHIWFMLESHNFLKALPDEELELVPWKIYYSEEFRERIIASDSEKMRVRPSAEASPKPQGALYMRRREDTSV